MTSRDITPQQCAQFIRESERTVCLTGAGISTAAGIADFRGPDGIYTTRKYNPETVFDIGHFHRDPSEFYRFTRDMLELSGKISPTFTHRFLGKLETAGLLQVVITQNIDPLHALGGSRNVIPIHGDYSTSHCVVCGSSFTFEELVRMLDTADIPRCECGGVIKPDVVFFGEAVRGVYQAEELASEADLMLVLGSSLTVYPAAALPSVVPGKVVVINKGDTILPSGAYFADTDLDDFFGSVAEELGDLRDPAAGV